MEIAKLYITLAADASSYQGTLQQVDRDTMSWASGLADRMAKTLGTAILAAVAAMTIAIGGFFVSAVDKAADLEAQMDTVAALLGATAEEAEKLRQATLDLALDPQLKVSATEAAQAIEMLAQNGLSVEEILGGAARATVLLANATGADFTTAARIATDAMSLWGMEASDLEQVANGVTAVLVQSKFEVNDYALALAQAGGVAAAVGVSFQDFNATLVAIAPYFASGSDAGTSFKTMLQRLIPSTNTAKDAMAALGLITEEGANAFFNADGSMKDMAEVAGILHGALSGLTEQQRLQALSTIFGTDAMRAAAAMSQFTEEEFRNLMAVMANTSAAEIAAQRMENFSGAMEIFKGVVEGLQLMLGNVLLPILTELALSASKLLSAWGPPVIAVFQSFTDNLSEGMSVIDAFIEAIWDIAPEPVLNGLVALRDHILPVVERIAEAIASFVSWKDALLAFGLVAAWAVGSVLLPMLAPIAGIVAAVAGLALAIAAVRTAWERDFLGIRTAVEGVVETIGRFVEAFRDSFQDSGDVIGALVVAFQNLVGPTTEAGQAFLEIGDKVREIIGVVQGVFQPTIDRIKEAIGGLGDSLAPVGEKLVGLKDTFWGLLQALAPVGAAIAAVVGIIAKFLGEVLAGVIKNAGTIIGGLVTAVTGVVDGVTNAVHTLVSSVQAILQGDWAGAWEAAKGFVAGWIDATRTQLEGLVQIVDGVLGAVWDAVVNTFNDLTGAALPSWEQFKQAAGEAFQGVVDRIREVLGTLREAVQPIIDFFAPTIERIVDAFSGLGDSLAPVGEKLAGLKEAFLRLGEALQPVFSVLQTIASFIGGVFLGTISKIGEVLAGVGAVIGAAVAVIAKFLGEVLAGIINNAGTIIGGLVTAVTGVVQGITSSVQAIVDFVRAVLQGDWAAAWAAAASYVSGMVSAVGTILGGLLQVIDGIFGAIWDAVVNTINDIAGSSLASWDQFKAGVIQKFTEIKESITSKVEEWKSAFLTFLDNVRSLDIGESIKTFITEGLENIVEAIRDQVAEWVDAFTGFVDDVQSADIGQSIVDYILEGLETFIDNVGETLSDWYSAFVDWVSDIDWYQVGYNIVDFIIQALVIFPQEVAATLAEWGQAFWDWAESTAADLWDAGVQLVENIIEGLREFPGLAWDALSEWASVFWDWASDTASELWDAGVELVRNIVEGLEEFPSEAESAVNNWAQVFWDWATATAAELWNAGVQIVQNIVEGLKEFPAKAQETLATWITAFAQWVGGSIAQLVIIGTAIVTHIVTGLKEFWVKAVVAVSGWFLSISTFVATKIASLIALGQSIVQGIIQGIQSMAQAVIDAAGSVIQGGVDAIRAALGNPHSPAPALIPLGSSISEGVAAGIVQGAGDIIGAIQQVASAAELEGVKAFGEAMTAIAEAIGAALSAALDIGSFGGTGEGFGAALEAMATMMAAIVTAVAEANTLSVEALEELGKFVDVAGEINDLLVQTADVTSYLAGWRAPVLEPVVASIEALAFYLNLITTALANANVFGLGTLEVLGKFVEVVGDIVEMIAPAIDALNVLGRTTFPDWEAFAHRVDALAPRLQRLVIALANANIYGLGALEILDKFIEVVGEIVEVVAPLIVMLSALGKATFPEWEAFVVRVDALAPRLQRLVIALANANIYGLSTLEVLGKFIEVVGDIVEMIAPAIDALNILGNATFPDWEAFAHRVDALAPRLQRLVIALANANIYGLGVLEILDKFIDVVGEIVDVIVPLVEMLNVLGNVTFPDWISFAHRVDALAPRLQRLVIALANANIYGLGALEVLGKFVEVVGDIVEMIAPAIDLLNMLGNATFPDWISFAHRVDALAPRLQRLVIALANANVFGLDALEVLSKFVEVVGEIIEMVEPAIEALNVLGNASFPDWATFAASADLLAAQLQALVGAFEAANQWSAEALAELGAFVDVVGDIVDLVGDAIEALLAIAAYNGQLSQGQLAAFTSQLVAVVAAMATAMAQAAAQAGELIEQAADFAESAEAILDVVEPGIEALTALAEYVGASGAVVAVWLFAADLVVIVQSLGAAFAAASVEMGAAAAQAAEFAANAEDIVNVVEPGVEALAALATYVSTAGLAGAVQTFAADLVTVIVTLVDALQQAGLLANQAVTEAGEMAEAMEDIVSVVAPAVEAVVTLVGYTTVGGLKTNVQQFAADLVLVIQTLVDGLAQAGLLASQAVTEAGEMAKHIQDILKVVEPALHKDNGAITLIAKYVSDGALIQKTQQFTDDLIAVTQILVDGLTTSALAAGVALVKAGEMAKSMKDLFDALKPAMDSIGSIAEYTSAAGLEQKAQQFTDDLIAVATVLVTGLTAAADQLGAEAVSAAHSFAQTVSLLVSRIQAVVSSLSTMGEIDTPNIEPILTYIVTSADQITEAFAAAGDIGQAVAYAEAFRANLAQLVGEVQAAVASLNALAGTGTTGSIGAALANIAASLENMEGEFAGAGDALAQALIAAMAGGISAGQGTVLQALDGVLTAANNAGLAAAREFDNVGAAIDDAMADGILAGQNQVVGAVTQVVNAAIAAGFNEAKKAASIGQELIRAALAEINAGRGQMDASGESAGGALIDGMARAILNGKSRLVNAIKDAVQAAVAAAEAALGIASPSRVAFELFDNFMKSAEIPLGDPQGLVGAIGRSTRAMVDEAARMMSQAAGLFTAPVGASPAVISGAQPARLTQPALAAAPSPAGRPMGQPAPVYNFYGNWVVEGVEDGQGLLEQLAAIAAGARRQ